MNKRHLSNSVIHVQLLRLVLVIVVIIIVTVVAAIQVKDLTLNLILSNQLQRHENLYKR
jgi:hypothetical protein